jgi:RNA polymerase sporulation-specific sigma factor
MDEEEEFVKHRDWLSMAANHWIQKMKDWQINLDYDDLIQIAAYGMLKALRTYDETKTASLRTWVHTHINNEILTEVRKCNKRVKTMSLTLLDDDDNEEFQKDIPYIEPGYDNLQNTIIIEKIKKILTDREFKILWLVAVEGKSQTEVAPSFNVQQPQIYRILKNIQNKIEKIKQAEGEDY